MDDFYHASILVNIRDERYHPMPFRPAPSPAEGMPEVGKMCRHKSIGHHTVGFATMEEAEAHIAEKGFSPTYMFEAWDGQDVPASVTFLPFMRPVEKPVEPPQAKPKTAHDNSPKECLRIAGEGGDPFKGVSTAYLLGKWRDFVATSVFGYLDVADDCESWSYYAAPSKEYVAYIRLLKAELDKRPHLPNKAEGKKARRAAARAGT